jgi:hypothetical protein
VPTQKKRGPARQPTPTSNNARRQHSAKALEPPREGDTFKVWCEACQSDADFDFRNGEWWFSSFDPDCPKGRECGRNLAGQGGCQPWQLKADPRPFLAGAIERRRSDRPDPLPTDASIDGWAAGLLSRPERLAWLTDERGLSVATIERLRLGWDPDRRTYCIPIFDKRGRVVNLMRRRQEGPARGLAGRGKTNRGMQLYPYPVPRGRRLLLCGGLLDAPLARQHGLPAVTSTHGVRSWMPSWDRYFVGRIVAVCFDVGEEQAAAKRAQALSDAGARRVCAVRLADTGMKKGEDITDWFMKYGCTADELESSIFDRGSAGR